MNNINTFKEEWKLKCPRCGQVHTDIARMKRHYARIKPCRGIYNTETKKYSGQPILDIDWKFLQDGIGVKSRVSKIAQKKAEEERLKLMEQMTFINCPLIVEEYAFVKDDIAERLLITFMNTYIKTGFITKLDLFKGLKNNKIEGKNFKKKEFSIHRLMKNFMLKVQDYINKKNNLICNNEIQKYKENYLIIKKVLKEKIHYHMNIKNSINDPITDHLPFFMKYNYELDLFPVPEFKQTKNNYPREGVVFSRRTLYIHNRITGEVIGYYEFEPEDWDANCIYRQRRWGGCPNLVNEEFLYKKIDYS